MLQGLPSKIGGIARRENYGLLGLREEHHAGKNGDKFHKILLF
jgi:hypothetical protein